MNVRETPDPVRAAAVLDADGVAALLSVSQSVFYARRPALEAAGFPQQLPGLARWSRACVLRWIETNGETYLPGPVEPRLEMVPTPLEREYAA